VSGIEYTPKEPKTKAAVARYTRQSRDNMSSGSKNKRNFFRNNPLEKGEFWIKLVQKDGSIRHFKVAEIQVSVDNDNWFEIPVSEKLSNE